jgi:hypothetical protein
MTSDCLFNLLRSSTKGLVPISEIKYNSLMFGIIKKYFTSEITIKDLINETSKLEFTMLRSYNLPVSYNNYGEKIDHYEKKNYIIIKNLDFYEKEKILYNDFLNNKSIIFYRYYKMYEKYKNNKLFEPYKNILIPYIKDSKYNHNESEQYKKYEIIDIAQQKRGHLNKYFIKYNKSVEHKRVDRTTEIILEKLDENIFEFIYNM